jgi:hypothetical protein
MSSRKRIVLAAVVGLVVAALAGGLGAVMKQNADYSADYVASQMAQQRITFKPAELLTEAEKAQPCVVANAGKALRTGKQAECYANSFIAVHLEQYGKGKTYAEWGTDEFALIAKITAAKDSGATPARVAALEADLAEIRATRTVLFQGETLRGILLTSFGFSTLGDKAAQAATVAFGVAALLGVAGLVTLMATGAAALKTRTVGTLAPAAS